MINNEALWIMQTGAAGSVWMWFDFKKTRQMTINIEYILTAMCYGAT